MKAQPRFSAGRLGAPLQMAKIIHARYRRRQIILDQPFFFPRPEARQDQNPFADARLAQLHSFVRAGYAEPLRPGLLQRLCHWHRAQAVCVRLHHRQNFSLRAHLLPNRAQVMQDRLQRNLRPHRASRKLDCFRHRHLECQTPRRARERICHSHFASRRLGKHPDWIAAGCLATSSHPCASPFDRCKYQTQIELFNVEASGVVGSKQVTSRNSGSSRHVCGFACTLPARYSSGSPPALHASGAASSNRVCRARKTKFRFPVGPLRCLAMISSAFARSSSGKSVL